MVIPVHCPGLRIQQAAPPRRCPECAGEISRATRLPVDRLVSLVKPVRRYRCSNFTCQWEGHLRIDKLADARDDGIEEGGRPRLTLVTVLFWTVVLAALMVVLWPAMVDLLPEFSGAMLLPFRWQSARPSVA